METKTAVRITNKQEVKVEIHRDIVYLIDLMLKIDKNVFDEHFIIKEDEENDL